MVSTRAAAERVPAGATGVLDAEPGFGPLAGIAALLARAPEPWLLVVPVDLPLFPAGVGRAMADAAGEDEAVVFEWRGRVEPFPALIARRSRRGVAICSTGAFVEPMPSTPRLAAASSRSRRRFPGRDPHARSSTSIRPEDLARAEGLVASEPR